MENASKALLIAGGILFSMLILSLLVLLFSNINSVNMSKEEKQNAKQLKEFNQQWEAYDKKALYGTELITVMNMSIENNIKMNTIENKDDRYYVNVIITINKNYETTVERYDTTKKKNDPNYHTTPTRDLPREVRSLMKKISPGTIKLGDKYRDGSFKINDTVKNMFRGATQDATITSGKYIYVVKSALTNFKTDVFKCTKIEYKDGRVTEINFEPR